MQERFSQKFDVAADYLFARLSDFETFEKRAATRGVQFRRLSRGPVRIGTRWEISLPVGHRMRRFKAVLSEFEEPRVLSYRSQSSRYEAALSLTVTPLAAQQSRLDVLLVASPRGYAANMAFGALRITRKLARRRVRRALAAAAIRLSGDYAQRRR